MALGDIRCPLDFVDRKESMYFQREREESLANILESIYYWVALWPSLHKGLNQIPFSDWLRGWDVVL